MPLTISCVYKPFQPRLATQGVDCPTTLTLLIPLVIYLFVQFVNLFLKMLLLRKLWADFNETQFKIFLGTQGIKVVVVCAYIAYISRVIIAYILTFEQCMLHMSPLMLRPCDCDVTIEDVLLWSIFLDQFYTPLYCDHQILNHGC